ncbi:MAG: hypothetical protein QGI21_05685 [Candidatus Poseidoniaceae archaeon]|jgi:hypothetical protein|nr:hypothetical protein [Candidatus Poseidoniaceae archaeon]
MDPRHPRISLAASILAISISVILILNLFAGKFLGHSGEKFQFVGWIWGDSWVSNSWSLQEWFALTMIVACIGLTYWARREFSTPIVHEHGSSSDQYAALEDLPTMVNLDNSNDIVNPNTAAVIASIVGETQSQTKQVVSSAIDALSTGEIGRSSAEVVSHNDVNHANVNVELPSAMNLENRAVPLPAIPDLELPELSILPNIPEMIDLDDLLSEEAVDLPPLDLPELPDF